MSDFNPSPFRRSKMMRPQVNLPPLDDVIKDYLVLVLTSCNWNFQHAGEVLKIDRRTVYRMAERFALQRPAELPDPEPEDGAAECLFCSRVHGRGACP